MNLTDDYIDELIEEHGIEVAGKYFDSENIYNALSIDNYKGTQDIANLLLSIGDDSTFNDILGDMTEGDLTINKLAIIIYNNR